MHKQTAETGPANTIHDANGSVHRNNGPDQFSHVFWFANRRKKITLIGTETSTTVDDDDDAADAADANEA